MSNTKLPSITSSSGKTTGSITHVTGGGNNSGGYINVGAEVSHNIGKNTQVFGGGDVGRYQSFQGGGGKTSGGGYIGIRHNF